MSSHWGSISFREWNGRVCTWLDARVHTLEPESLDRTDHPEREKLRQVRLLHAQNLLIGSYKRYLRVLEPLIARVRAMRPGKPVRVLELASGDGNMAIAIADHAVRRGLDVEVTGSDVVPAYVARANDRAKHNGSTARFRVIDGFAPNAIERGAFDVVFMAQSAHHFSPGKLAVLIAQAERAGASYAVIVDGHRSARLMLGLTTLASFSLNWHFTHDAWLSTRRFYSELELLARIASPHADVTVRTVTPFTTVLTVAFTGGSHA